MKWSLEKQKINELHEYALNARQLKKHDRDHLQQSISTFGQCEPIVVNTDGTVIGGHQRIRMMRKMGYKEIDTYVPDEPLTNKEVQELNIRLNRNNGEWDWDMLGNAWDPTDLVEYGFTTEEMHLEELPPGEPGEENDGKQKSCTMTIYFSNVDHLQEAENRIALIVDEYEGARYKVKV